MNTFKILLQSIYVTKLLDFSRIDLEYVIFKLCKYNITKMTCPPEHVATWMIGVQFQKQLDPLQNLVFQLFLRAPVANSPKVAFERALGDFRSMHFNKYLYELERPSAMEVSFIERMKKIDTIKKPAKKDYVSLFKDLQLFKSCTWPGGRRNGESVLKDWHPDLRKCKAMYPDWYADEVKQVRLQFKLTEHKCAVSQARYPWTTYEGTACPANIRVFSDVADERVEAYKEACQPYVLQVDCNILHIAQSFYQMYVDMANTGGKDAKLHLQELYASRTPTGYDLVAQKRSLEKNMHMLQAENERLKMDLNEKVEQNRHLNLLSDELTTTIDAMSKQISDANYALSQFQGALHERDNIIRQIQLHQTQLHQTQLHQTQLPLMPSSVLH